MRKIALAGKPVEIRYEAGLRDTSGNAAHAATWIRRRLIVLDEELRAAPREHCRILAHELFHFVWVRLGNGARRSWQDLLREESRRRARGETGWSAEWRRRALTGADMDQRSRRWREYCCESFCDTGAWLVSGEAAELTLARGHCERRRKWFEPILTAPLSI
ncbi:MAG: hypothetical protein ABJC09_07115 [Terriglobia bacterium]